MKVSVMNLKNQKVGEADLLDSMWDVSPRRDLFARVVRWQLAGARQGSHKTKIVSEVSGTTRKPYKQKGTGRARQGSLRSAQFRKGGIIFGPVVRDHSHDLTKKVRSLALKMALSTRQKEGKLIVLDAAKTDSHKTKALLADLQGLCGPSKVLVIDGANLDSNFAKAIRNIPSMNVLPAGGANVYDILRHDTLVVTMQGLEQLQARLGGVSVQTDGGM